MSELVIEITVRHRTSREIATVRVNIPFPGDVIGSGTYAAIANRFVPISFDVLHVRGLTPQLPKTVDPLLGG